MDNSDTDPLLNLFNVIAFSATGTATSKIILQVSIFILLVAFSALISGSETAFFSLNRSDINKLKSSSLFSDKIITLLLSTPRKLLATLLLTNNLLNIALIILATVLSNYVIGPYSNEPAGMILEIIGITFLIVFLTEVLPKIYATQNNLVLCRLMAFPLYTIDKLLRPFSNLLVYSTSFTEKKKNNENKKQLENLSEAIEITSTDESLTEEKKILKGIAEFGYLDVSQIMTSRLDIAAIDYDWDYTTLLNKIREYGYSRMPVYKGDIDTIEGVLYIKDLLSFIDQTKNFEWQKLIRTPYFVPERKKINELLNEFKEKKMHLAIVVDEYGGTSGIVSMEDILEEIVGEINDEYDDEELQYSKLDENNFVFEGKILLSDLCRVTGIEEPEFEDENKRDESLARFLIRISGRIPQKKEIINYKTYRFKIESSDRRRINRVKFTILHTETENTPQKKMKNVLNSLLWPLISIAILLSACNEDYTPKPPGYFRIDLPKKEYRNYESDCPYTFEYPAYSSVVIDTNRNSEPCWINIVFPKFKGKIHISYKPVKGNITQLTEDSRSLAYKHTVKANSIDEEIISNPSKKVYGVLYDIQGNAASALQFYVTDSSRNFLRASLYFNVPPKSDSLAPVIDFVNQDVRHMIETFRWK